MAAPTGIETSGALMALTQGVAAWFAVVPDMKRVNASTVDDTDFTHEFRRGEIVASGITLGVGALGSIFIKSWYPVVASVVIVILLVVCYEFSLRADPTPQ